MNDLNRYIPSRMNTLEAIATTYACTLTHAGGRWMLLCPNPRAYAKAMRAVGQLPIIPPLTMACADGGMADGELIEALRQ